MSHDNELQQILSGMTNWQKSQYCKAKRKGVAMPIDQVREIAARKRRS